MTVERTVVVLAAGEGRRMKSGLPKMLHPLLGRTLLGHVLAATSALHAAHRIVVVGHGADEITKHLAEAAPDAVTVLQEVQRGRRNLPSFAPSQKGLLTGSSTSGIGLV